MATGCWVVFIECLSVELVLFTVKRDFWSRKRISPQESEELIRSLKDHVNLRYESEATIAALRLSAVDPRANQSRPWRVLRVQDLVGDLVGPLLLDDVGDPLDDVAAELGLLALVPSVVASFSLLQLAQKIGELRIHARLQGAAGSQRGDNF
jgi:hypothetical protein